MNKQYHEIPAKALFKVLVPEYFGGSVIDGKVIGRRKVDNGGIYVKISNSHAKEISTGKDCIFPLKIMCRQLPGNMDTSKFEDWKLINQGNPNEH